MLFSTVIFWYTFFSAGCLPEEDDNNEFCFQNLPEGETDLECIDGEDNDGDGYIDCEDQGCFNRQVCLQDETDDEETDDTASFCSSFADAGAEETEALDIPGYGVFEVQLLVDETDPRDGEFIGNATYTYQELMSAEEEEGQADELGSFVETLSPGIWTFKITGPTDCQNEVEVVIEEGIRLHQCVALNCE